MWRRKKIIVIALLAIVIVAGSVSGAVLASDNNEEDGTAPEFGSFIDRVLEIYQEKTGTVVDKEALQESFNQAREEMRAERPRIRFHGRLFDDEVLTQEQRDEIEAWLEARPEIPTEEFKEWLESRPNLLPDDFKEWLESRPDFLDDEMAAWFDNCPEVMPFEFGIRSRFGHHGFGFMGKAGDKFMFGIFKNSEDS